MDIAEFTQTSKSYDEILDFANKREISHDLIKKAIQKKVILIDKDYKPRNNLVKRNKYFLDLLLDNPNNFNLEKEHIILVGCGGIGNFMSYPLSSLGIGEISLIDGDTIEESNLNRQFLFSRDDIGKNKVDTIGEKISKNDSEIIINKYCSKVTLSILNDILCNSKYKPSLIILSADDLYCLKLINIFATKNSIPFLNIGYLNDFSVIGPFYIPNVSSCAFCSDIGVSFSDELDVELLNRIKLINGEFNTPAFFTNNAFAASMALIDIIYYFSGEFSSINSLNKRIGIDNHDFTKHILDTPLNKNCKFCGVNKND